MPERLIMPVVSTWRRIQQAGLGWFLAAILVLGAGQLYGYLLLTQTQHQSLHLAYEQCLSRNADQQVFRDLFDELLSSSPRPAAREFYQRYRARLGDPIDCNTWLRR